MVPTVQKKLSCHLIISFAVHTLPARSNVPVDFRHPLHCPDVDVAEVRLDLRHGGTLSATNGKVCKYSSVHSRRVFPRTTYVQSQQRTHPTKTNPPDACSHRKFC